MYSFPPNKSSTSVTFSKLSLTSPGGTFGMLKMRAAAEFPPSWFRVLRGCHQACCPLAAARGELVSGSPLRWERATRAASPHE